jgi:hypothetical protein
MNTTQLLDETKQRLKDAGVRDVKFLFNADLTSRSPSTVCNQAAVLLGAYLDGHHSPCKPVGKLTHAG